MYSNLGMVHDSFGQTQHQKRWRVHLPRCATGHCRSLHGLCLFVQHQVQYKSTVAEIGRKYVLAVTPVIGTTRHEAGGATSIESVRFQDVGGRSGVDTQKERGANDAIGIEHGTGRPVAVSSHA